MRSNGHSFPLLRIFYSKVGLNFIFCINNKKMMIALVKKAIYNLIEHRSMCERENRER